MFRDIRIFCSISYFQDLSLDHSSISMLDEDELIEDVPPSSPFRRGGVSSGSLKAKKKTEIIPKDTRSKESLSRVFNTNLFFSHLDADERDEISDAMFRQTAAPGDVIIKQGEEGDNFYIIDLVDITKNFNWSILSSKHFY